MIKTQTIFRPGGRREIVRMLTTEDLQTWSKDDPLAYEKSVVWLEDISAIPFVRVVDVRCARSRRGRLRLSGGQRVVGYSKLMADAPRDPDTKRFTRRLFYLEQTDLASPAEPTPERSVDPNTVLPGFAGRAPDRCEEQADSE